MAHAAAYGETSSSEKGLGYYFFQALKFILIAVVVVLIVLLLVGSFRTGRLGSVIKHTAVETEEAGVNPVANFFKTSRVFSPIYYAFNPEESNPFAIDPEVEINADNEDLGVEIAEFKPIRNFFMPPEDHPILLGRVKAHGLNAPITIATFCSLEDYREDQPPIPADIVNNPFARGNQITVEQGQPVEFNVQCSFPGDIPMERQNEARTAKLIVVYEFVTRSYQRVWFIDRDTLISLGNQNPFQYYNIQDPLMQADRRIKSKTTPGPMKLGIDIAAVQPLTTQTKYTMLVDLTRAFASGDLQRLDSITIQVPSINTLDIALSGEQGFGVESTTCDFEYADTLPDGFKEYRLASSELADINQDCDRVSLRELAITESKCISAFKNPRFLCDFTVTKVPQGLGSDVITATAEYTFKVEKQTVVDLLKATA